MASCWLQPEGEFRPSQRTDTGLGRVLRPRAARGGGPMGSDSNELTTHHPQEEAKVTTIKRWRIKDEPPFVALLSQRKPTLEDWTASPNGRVAVTAHKSPVAGNVADFEVRELPSQRLLIRFP